MRTTLLQTTRISQTTRTGATTMTETLTRIGNGTILRRPLATATEDTLPRMRTMVVVGMAIIPTLIHTAAMDGAHSPRTTITVIGMRTISSLLRSAMIEGIHFPTATKMLTCTGTSLDHLIPATTAGAIHFPEIMVPNTPTIEAVATPRATHTQITTTRPDKEVIMTMPTTTDPLMAHLETVDHHTRTPTIDRGNTRALHRMAPMSQAAAGTADTDTDTP